MVRRDILLLQEKKKKFYHFIQTVLTQNRLEAALQAAAAFPETVRGMGGAYRRRQEAALDDLTALKRLKDKAGKALENGMTGRKENGGFENADLNAYILIYLQYHGLPAAALQNMNDEQATAFATQALEDHAQTAMSIGAYSEDLGRVAEIFESFDSSGALSAALQEIMADETLSDEQKLEALSDKLDPEMRGLIRKLKEADISDKVFNQALDDLEAKAGVIDHEPTTNNFFSM